MNPEKEAEIRHDAMMDAAREHAVEHMKDWFLERYEDPVHNTPYETAEGGYIYIWGGPFDARDVLYAQFGSENPEELIEEVASELERECTEWARIPTADDYDLGDEPVAEYLARAEVSLEHVRKTLEQSAETPFMNALLYAHVIGVLEAFLYESFASALKDQTAFRAFIESDPTFQEERLKVSDIFKAMDGLKTKATERIQSLVFHRLEVVQRMFKATLGVDLPPGIGELLKAISIRHDIVHRNCARKDGTNFDVTKQQVTELLDLTTRFIRELSARIDRRSPETKSVSSP
jgi:hypothetical protein